MEFNIKRAVLERDNFTCQICGFKGSYRELMCHHIHYESPQDPKACMTLCKKCHHFVTLFQYPHYLRKHTEDLPYHILKSIKFPKKGENVDVVWVLEDYVNPKNLAKATSWGKRMGKTWVSIKGESKRGKSRNLSRKKKKG